MGSAAVRSGAIRRAGTLGLGTVYFDRHTGLTFRSPDRKRRLDVADIGRRRQFGRQKSVVTPNDLSVNTSSLSKGMYFIKIATDNASMSLPFVKK